jgi:hypothetical protein
VYSYFVQEEDFDLSSKDKAHLISFLALHLLPFKDSTSAGGIVTTETPVDYAILLGNEKVRMSLSKGPVGVNVEKSTKRKRASGDKGNSDKEDEESLADTRMRACYTPGTHGSSGMTTFIGEKTIKSIKGKVKASDQQKFNWETGIFLGDTGADEMAVDDEGEVIPDVFIVSSTIIDSQVQAWKDEIKVKMEKGKGKETS